MAGRQAIVLAMAAFPAAQPGSGLAALVSRRLGGLTGDTYGAVNEVAEMLTLLLLGLVTAANCSPTRMADLVHLAMVG